jgi:hypothetical protein
MERSVQHARPDHWVLIKVLIRDTGYTDDAIRAKVRREVWAPRAHWRKAPDGHLVFNLPRIQEWMSSLGVQDGRSDHWVLINNLAWNTGYTEDAIRKKRRRHGVWKEAPDGRLVFNFTRIQEWMSSAD